MDEDVFDSLLNLEDDYYEEGYRQGVDDGSRAGRIEGRVFGLEKGFEKFLEMGKLNGRACVWAARISRNEAIKEATSVTQETRQGLPEQADSNGGVLNQNENENISEIPHLPQNSRLEKHITTLYALTEAESLSTENNEEAVSDFDDRFKRAVSKTKVIENIIKERSVDDNMEDTGKSKNRVETQDRVKMTKATTTEKNMEDFGVKRAQ